ncbi:alpha/beta hydrolase family protein [Nocardia tenerifensis]|uniref:Alpha/beta hydrolase family protein n=1 Tax=Nocardia tenerifensis TaxID=228006 RepID=A0A318KQ08_9NOCA|nr:alpha/beta hydrolase family protein [Nocardia tenerifensis]
MLTAVLGRWRSRTVILLTALMLLIATGDQLATASPDSPPGGVPGVAVPELNWVDCGDPGYQCATADVPLDYHHPGAGTISLAVRRHLAGDPARRIGSLFVNPGGPGGSGIGFVTSVVETMPAEIAARFDVVGFDPRGVGKSRAVQCWTAEEMQQAWAETPAQWRLGAFERGQDFAARFDAACQARSGDLLPYIGTEFVARDMDVLRAAVGDDRISYLGVSFGTMIGTVYANLFPQRIRVSVLDGAYNPETYANDPYAYDYGQYRELESAINRFLGWCAEDRAACPFGDPASGGPAAALDALVADLSDHPVRDESGQVVADGATLVNALMLQINGGRAAWPTIADSLRQAAEHRDGPALRPVGRYAALYAANVAVECADRVYPPTTLELQARLGLDVAAAPRMGPIAAWGPPGYDHSHANACQRWPAPRASRYAGPWTAPGSAPILVVGTTGDPDTPYPDAVALASMLENGRLLTVTGEGHSGFGHSQCARDAETTYLIESAAPPSGTTCAGDTD